MRITPVILSGGGGTRLWPMSTPGRPKQFLALTGTQTMFQMTAQRTCDAAKFNPPIVVTGGAHANTAATQLSAIGIANPLFILEPCARNTAPAIALAALAAENADTPLLIMPSDHVIADPKAFQTAIEKALPLVEQDWLVTFGISPTAPETGYGYIQMSETIGNGVKRVAQFVEKPDLAKAEQMIASGDHVWNGGIFLFRAGRYLSALQQYAPDMLLAAQNAMQKASRENNQIHPDKNEFARCPSDSIDYAIMERSDKVATVPVAMGWSDVGSWDALYDLGMAGSGDNIIEIEGSGNLIKSDGIKIHTAGVSDMIIVASGNDILIVPRGKSQDVKKIVAKLPKD